MLDFAELKTIKVVEVLGERYKIRLRYRGDYASGLCPLPSHKTGDKDNSFAVHIPSNTWRCFSKSCGHERPSDVITLVQVMEKLGKPFEAAQKLDGWYKKSGSPITENRTVQKAIASPLSPHTENTSVSDSGKGFMAALDGWFNELFQLGPELVDDPFWTERRKAVKARIYESYVFGKSKARN